jgi:hypothetical protein
MAKHLAGMHCGTKKKQYFYLHSITSTKSPHNAMVVIHYSLSKYPCLTILYNGQNTSDFPMNATGKNTSQDNITFIICYMGQYGSIPVILWKNKLRLTLGFVNWIST